MTTSFSFFVAEAVSAVYALFIHKNHLADSRPRQSRNDSRKYPTGLQNSSIERPVERHPADPRNEKEKSDEHCEASWLSGTLPSSAARLSKLRRSEFAQWQMRKSACRERRKCSPVLYSKAFTTHSGTSSFFA